MLLLPTLVLYLFVVAQSFHTKSKGFGAPSRQGSGDFRQDYRLQSKLKKFVLSKRTSCDGDCQRLDARDTGRKGDYSMHKAFNSAIDDNDIYSERTRINATSDQSHSSPRHMLGKGRQRRWISTRKLKKQLHACEARLQETQEAFNAPTFLFVQ